MRRRDFIKVVAGSASTWPLAARAQQPAVPVVGWLGSDTRQSEDYRVAYVRQGLKEIGYSEGQNLAVEYSIAEGQYDRLPTNMLLSRHTRRREFISLLTSVAVGWPLAAGAQQPDRVRRLGVMMSGPTEADAEGQARVAALKLGLLERGWVEGRNLEIDYRWGGADSSRMRAYA